MPNQKTGPKRKGHEVPCVVCGTMKYRDLAYIARTKRITCASPECRSQAGRGENNPFWGKIHSEETRERIKETKRSRPAPKGTGPKKGIFRQTPEAKAKMSEALRLRWALNRDKMLAQYAHLKREKPREELRYRRNFTDAQRRDWKEPHCAWCKTSDDLVLDHIIPVSCGGENVRQNAQTLCRYCNIWKMAYVDRPLFLAGLDKKRA